MAIANAFNRILQQVRLLVDARSASVAGVGALRRLGANLLQLSDGTNWQDIGGYNPIFPTSLGSSQNNYNPTGFADATHVFIDASTDINITGLAAVQTGQRKNIVSVSSSTITLKANDVASDATNRFSFYGDISLRSADIVTLFYTGNNWIPINHIPLRAQGDSRSASDIGAGGMFWDAVLNAIAFSDASVKKPIFYIDAQIFTSSGTWTKPTGALLCWGEVYAGGCSGSTGRAAASGDRFGGNSGAGGAFCDFILPASVLGSTETITVGAGGAGVSGVSATANGNTGNPGGDSSIGSLVIAKAAGAAGAGTTSVGAGSNFFVVVSNWYGNGANGAVSSVSGGGGAGNGVIRAGGCGGAGGGISTGGTHYVGGTGGKGGGMPRTGSTSGSAATGGSAGGGNGSDGTSRSQGGDGGGGGGANNSGAGGNGGNGGIPAGGGGGGGAGTTASGNSGSGGRGEIRIYTLCGAGT